MTETTDCQSLFLRGDYATVIAQYLDSPRIKLTGENLPWVIGALCFTGRYDEAQALYQRLDQSGVTRLNTAESGRVACRYFLAVAHLRHNAWDAAAAFLIQNLKSARQRRHTTDAPLITFYAAQGMGFTRYRTGKLRQALIWAERAQMAAVAADFLYGRVLSGDLLGHIRVNLGLVRRGLRDFERTSILAQSLGQGAITQAIGSTLAIYKARFGIVPPNAAAEALKQQITSCRFEDSYTLASLHLENARVFRLAGQASLERSCLDAAMPLVYSVRSPHLEAQLNIRLAEPLLQSQNPRQALDIIRHSLTVSDPRDLTLRTKLKGLEYRAMFALGKISESENAKKEVCRLTKHTGHRLSARILDRSAGTYQADAMRGEDPLGDLLDEVHRDQHLGPERQRRVTSNIIASGWWGLLYRVLDIPLLRPAIAFDLEFGALTIFDQGDVVHIPDGVSALGRRFLEALAAGPKTKEQLIAAVWQLRYHQLKHDSLVYALVAKLRRVLGLRSNWLQATEDGYRLPAETLIVAAMESTVESTPIVADPFISFAKKDMDNRNSHDHSSNTNLNPRQTVILKYLRNGVLFDIQRGMAEFGASDATVSRDLAHLVTLGLAERIGRGRATKYRAISAQNKKKTIVKSHFAKEEHL